VTPRANALGDYLRSRREQLCPEDVGLIAGTRRRVAGLRREEVATLAGISAAYYLRLEQGRDVHPSGQVVDALAQALRLDLKSTEYLHRLATPTGTRRPESTVETVSDELRELIDQISLPVVAINKYLDVLAANPCARVLSPGLQPGRNFMCWLLREPDAREFYVDWEKSTEIVVSEFREIAGSDLDDPRLRALIDGLSSECGRFRELWSRADVGYSSGMTRIRHPQAGELHLHRRRLSVPHSGGLHLMIYHAEPGSESAKALEELRLLADGRDPKWSASAPSSGEL
jgi:transcriptional regulator with XRE-family HTH domain